MSKQLWETRPFEIWGKAKEMRAKWQKNLHSDDRLLSHGNTGEIDWAIGYFKQLNISEDNPAGAMIQSKSSPFARKSRLATEIRGWGRELCGYVNTCWGAQFLGYDFDEFPFGYRDMSVAFPDTCDQHCKRGQQCMDYSPIPRWGGDWPMYLGPIDPEREQALIDQKVYTTLLTINDIERTFGIKFDDEAFLNNLSVRRRLLKYGIKIMELMSHVPSPIGQKDLYSFYTLGSLTKYDAEETVSFWKELTDEIQWRADNNIAAVANERYRWMEAHPPPWHFLSYYRYMEQYGALCIGSQYTHLMTSNMWNMDEDGKLILDPYPLPPADQPIKTREDGIRYIFTEARGRRFKDDEYYRKEKITDFAKYFKVDGAIMPLWRSGVGCTLTRKEQALRLMDMGVRVLHYEGPQPGDRTDLDEHDFLDKLDIWMESQGLEKITD